MQAVLSRCEAEDHYLIFFGRQVPTKAKRGMKEGIENKAWGIPFFFLFFINHLFSLYIDR